MKALAIAIGLLAIINLMGMLGALAWLMTTQRLTPERIDAIREILHEPYPVEQARLQAEAAQAEAGSGDEGDVDALDLIELPEGPPIGASSQVALQQEQDQADEFRAQRLDRENAVLSQTTSLVFRQLDQERQEFEEEKVQFEKMRDGIAALRGDTQFLAALSVLENVKATVAKDMLTELIEGRAGELAVGDAPDMSGTDRAVAYLNELGAYQRGLILSQFTKDSPTMAADLLERLRTFGISAGESGDTEP